MPKSQYVDPGKVFQPGFISFNDIPVCQYKKTLAQEKKIYTKDDFLRIYRDMRIIREFESMLNDIKVKSEYNGIKYNNPGPAHLSIGQEASAVGEAYCLDINDFTFGSHRSHGEIIAKGLSSIHKLTEEELYDIMKEFFDGAILKVVEGRQEKQGDVRDLAIDFLLYGALAEVFARTTGFNRGLGGSMHAFFIPFGIFPNNAIVGGAAPVALGAALYKRANHKKGIVVANSGDGALGRGPVLEAFNMASMRQITELWGMDGKYSDEGMPILFNVFNNFYGMGGQTMGETMGYTNPARLAAGYDYDTAIAKLEGFTGNKEKYPEMEIRLSEYKQQKSLLIAHNDPGAIPNLSFHVLIADPSRAFSNREFGGQYNKNFVTTDEFEKILDQLYIGGYVLVDFDSFIAETVTGETITYSSKPLYLPDGKKPIMITETMVNYFNYMIDSNSDGVADQGGAGFASKLVLQNGEIKAQMVNSSGETVIGNYDLVPILEDFIEKHPDFSYQGARAILAVTGHEGIFGYRTNASVIDSKGQAYYDAEVAGAREIAAALKEAGYEFASFTYENKKYGDMDATSIQKDISKWTSEVLPIIGSCDILVYAKESDISASGDYSNSKFNVLQDAGFRYFISNASSPSCKVAGNYVRQLRLMVTGSHMAHASTTYSKYFDSQTVLNDKRGNVPQ